MRQFKMSPAVNFILYDHFSVEVSFPIDAELIIKKTGLKKLINQKIPDHLIEATIQLRATGVTAN